MCLSVSIGNRCFLPLVLTRTVLSSRYRSASPERYRVSIATPQSQQKREFEHPAQHGTIDAGGMDSWESRTDIASMAASILVRRSSLRSTDRKSTRLNSSN